MTAVVKQREFVQHSGPIPKIEDVAIRLDAPIEEGPDLIFDGLLPKGSEVVIAGETNVGKSLISLEMISSFTTGMPLWGKLEPKFQAKKVLYVLAEHHDAVVQKLWQKTKLPLGGDVFLLGPEALSFDKWIIQRGSPNHVAIDKLKRWSEGCDLVVWDPLSAFLIGEGVEQDNVTMRLLLDMMNLICANSGAACIVLAHQGKPQMDQFGKEHRRQTYAIRGASGTEDAATSIFYLNRDENVPGGKNFEMVCRKFKGDSVDRFCLLRNPDTLTHTLIEPQNAYTQAVEIDLNSKINRLLAAHPDFSYRTAQRILASVEGIALETLQRRMGQKPEINKVT